MIFADCMSPCSDDESGHHSAQAPPPLPPTAAAIAAAAAAVAVGKQQLLESVPHVSLVPMQSASISSPERRIIAQKEIIAGEERPKYLLINNQPDVGPGNCNCHTRVLTIFTHPVQQPLTRTQSPHVYIRCTRIVLFYCDFIPGEYAALFFRSPPYTHTQCRAARVHFHRPSHALSSFAREYIVPHARARVVTAYNGF